MNIKCQEDVFEDVLGLSRSMLKSPRIKHFFFSV